VPLRPLLAEPRAQVRLLSRRAGPEEVLGEQLRGQYPERLPREALVHPFRRIQDVVDEIVALSGAPDDVAARASQRPHDREHEPILEPAELLVGEALPRAALLALLLGTCEDLPRCLIERGAHNGEERQEVALPAPVLRLQPPALPLARQHLVEDLLCEGADLGGRDEVLDGAPVERVAAEQGFPRTRGISMTAEAVEGHRLERDRVLRSERQLDDLSERPPHVLEQACQGHSTSQMWPASSASWSTTTP